MLVNVGDRRESEENAGPEKKFWICTKILTDTSVHFKRSENVDYKVVVWRLLKGAVTPQRSGQHNRIGRNIRKEIILGIVPHEQPITIINEWISKQSATAFSFRFNSSQKTNTGVKVRCVNAIERRWSAGIGRERWSGKRF